MRRVFGGTDTGVVRETNQDRFVCEAVSDTLAFAVLCDGMGGENGGSIASEIATEFAAQMLRRELSPGAELGETTLKNMLLSGISGANALVFDQAQKDEDLTGMGTTMIAAVFCQDILYVAYVGDSRVYCVTPERELQLTKDHTVVQMLVDKGEISEQDAKVHPQRHYITRAVGVSPDVEVDFAVQKLEPDEMVLLCSDGLYTYLQPDTLFGLLRRCVEENSADPLIQMAREAGGSDNITAVVAC